MIAALLALAAAAAPPAAEQAAAARVARAAEASGIVGEVLVGFPTWHASTCRPAKTSCGDDLWRRASVTKQVVAVLVMQEVASGRIDLDAPVSRYLPTFRSANAATATVRQLLRHQAGLPNPDATPDAGGFPSYYTAAFAGSRDPRTGYCAGPVSGPPGGAWTYNNCDYIVAGALLEAVTGRPWQTLVAERIARPLGLRTLGAFPTRRRTVTATIDGKPELAIRVETFGAAAGLYGSAADLYRLDRALMAGRLLAPAQRDAMWAGDPKLGYMGLGQWAFSARLKGCAAPIRIVERRGEIGGVGVRNFILPDLDRVVIAFTNRGGFDFGEVWQGRGPSFDLLSAAACA